MLIPDINVLIYAHREELPEHVKYADWLTRIVQGDEPFGVSALVTFGFVRIVTNPRAFKTPTPLDQAFAFVSELLACPNCLRLSPGERHWEIFERLCRETQVTGKLTADAHHAALAIEHGGQWVSADGDFARFRGLRWQHPFAPPPR